MKKKSNRTLLLASLVAIGSLAQNAQSAVVVYFEQDGSDVKISWSGTLDITVSSSVSSTNSFGSGIQETANLSANGPVARDTQAGSATATTIDTAVIQTQRAEPGTVGSWGFNSSSLYWSTSIVSTGTLEAATQLTFDPTQQFMFARNQTLANLNADTFDNTLAWTATSGDTISYTTGSAPIPEPSSAFLGGLSTLFLLRRRVR